MFKHFWMELIIEDRMAFVCHIDNDDVSAQTWKRKKKLSELINKKDRLSQVVAIVLIWE